jgi:hypothetical protein
MRMTILAIATLIAHVELGAAQAPANAVAPGEAFHRIAAAHRDVRAYGLQIDALVTTGTATMPLQATVKCDSERRCLRRFQNSITLETPDRSLLINTMQRTITVSNPSNREPDHSAASGDPAAAIDKWLQNGGAISGGELSAAGRHWLVQTGNAAIPAIEMYVDESTHLVRRLVYETTSPGAAKTTVDVSYSWGDPSRLNPDDFDERQFVHEKSGTLVPANAYANYRLITADPR